MAEIKFQAFRDVELENWNNFILQLLTQDKTD